MSVIYLIGVLAVLRGTGFGILADFGSPEGVVGLMTNPDIALIAWIHLLAFDHLVSSSSVTTSATTWSPSRFSRFSS